MSSKLTIHDVLMHPAWEQTSPMELTEEQLAAVLGGGFWEGLATAVVGVGAIAAAVVSLVVAPEITIPLALTAATAALGGAKTAVDGAVEAYDERHTWDDGAASRSQTAYDDYYSMY